MSYYHLQLRTPLLQFLWIMSPRRLYELDRSSAQFPDRLYQLLHDKEHVECLQKLPEDEVVQLIDYLNDVRVSLMSVKWYQWLHPQVLGQLDCTSQPFRKCFQVLQKICSFWAILPASYQVSEALSFTSKVPAAFGGFCDAYKGTLSTGAAVCIKRIRICTTDDKEKLKQARPPVQPPVGSSFMARFCSRFARRLWCGNA